MTSSSTPSYSASK
jgi:hypothetical protein